MCSPSLTLRARLESAGWLQRAEASAASSCRFCNKLLLLCFCATPGAFPEARQVGRYGRLCWECCWVSLRSHTASLLPNPVPGTACWECCCTHPLPRSRFCDTFFSFILFSNGYPTHWGKHSSRIQILFKNSTNSFKTPQLSQLCCNLGASPSSKICGMSSISWC